MNKGEIQIYKAVNGTHIEVKLHDDTVWLDAHLIASMFNVNRPAIVKHLQNIYKSGELVKEQTCSVLEQVAGDGKRRRMNLYNLDAIISVGYRVNSKEATQFRQWATQRLKDYLVIGYAANQKRLEELGRVVQLMERAVSTDLGYVREVGGLLQIISDYTRSFLLLNRYDSQKFENDILNENITFEIGYNEAKSAIAELKRQLIKRKEATDLFGREKDDGFRSSLSAIIQTFDGKYLYPTIEEQAAYLLYFVVKNHSFNDGNKRIGAFLFVWFLERNKHMYRREGELKINDNGLAALTLLVAASKSEEKEMIIQLIIALISNNSV